MSGISQTLHAAVQGIAQCLPIDWINGVCRPYFIGVVALHAVEDHRSLTLLRHILQFTQMLGSSGAHCVWEIGNVVFDQGDALDLDERLVIAVFKKQIDAAVFVPVRHFLSNARVSVKLCYQAGFDSVSHQAVRQAGIDSHHDLGANFHHFPTVTVFSVRVVIGAQPDSAA